MKIAIIGKGNVGSAFCEGLSKSTKQSLATETQQNQLLTQQNGEN